MLVKNFLLGAILLGAIQAWAYPKVGDKAEWAGTIVSGDGTSVAVKVTKEVMSFNETTKKWTVKEEKTIGDKMETETNEVSRLYSSEDYTKVIAMCESKGGKLESITVPAGTYNTCSYTKSDKGKDDDETVTKWIGDVPFAIVKKVKDDKEDKEVTTLELQSVTLGQ
ncbi:hypothetical protein [Bdellovibrio sp. HCB2-146]|uniref:hypothetical protein n=1 Tax=Bdellovibrio sp. HCB2-146 TaxID=3394362 RepID=UPI0039BD60E8